MAEDWQEVYKPDIGDWKDNGRGIIIHATTTSRDKIVSSCPSWMAIWMHECAPQPETNLGVVGIFRGNDKEIWAIAGYYPQGGDGFNQTDSIIIKDSTKYILELYRLRDPIRIHMAIVEYDTGKVIINRDIETNRLNGELVIMVEICSDERYRHLGMTESISTVFWRSENWKYCLVSPFDCYDWNFSASRIEEQYYHEPEDNDIRLLTYTDHARHWIRPST